MLLLNWLSVDLFHRCVMTSQTNTALIRDLFQGVFLFCTSAISMNLRFVLWHRLHSVSILNSRCTKDPEILDKVTVSLSHHDHHPLFVFTQNCYYRLSGEIYIGGIKSHKYNKNRCLVDPGEGHVPGLHDCKLAKEKGFHMYWDFKQVLTLSVCVCMHVWYGPNKFWM